MSGRLVLLCSLVAFSLCGCSGLDPLLDLEMARNEARYVPAEVAGTLALGMLRAADYGEHSSLVHQSYGVGDPITQDGCIGVNLLEGVGDDGHGSVQYDFAGCSGQAGGVRVDQLFEFQLPEGARDEIPEDDWTDEDGDGIPDNLPGGGGDIDWENLTEEELAALLDVSADVEISYQGYREGSLRMNGSLGMTGGLDAEASAGGALTADIAVRFLEYGGVLTAAGDWTFGSDEDTRNFSFLGDFESSAGLPWTVMASNIGMTPGCVDASSGELTAIFSNSAGDVEVTARFDSVCDGCADLSIDGIEQGRICLPEMANIGNSAGTQ